MLMQHIGVGYFEPLKSQFNLPSQTVTLSYARDCEVKNEGSELLG
jgi:hypothetical protein